MDGEKALTSTQEKVLGFLKDFHKKKGYPPTLREIAGHFGLKGPRAPQKTLGILEKKGYLRRIPGGSRAIELLDGASRTAERPRVISLPLVGRVRAGEPVLALENVEGYVAFDRDLVSSDDAFLLRVEGDSMIDAHIQDGDFALVKPQSHAGNGEIVVALIEDEATVKRIFKEKDLVRLEPANPKMDPILVRKGEKRVAIVGKVIGIFRRMG
jgi:repressor LexA